VTGRRPLAEVLVVYALAFVGCVGFGLLQGVHGFFDENVLGFVGLLFLGLPLLVCDRIGRKPAAFGFTSRHWHRGALLALGVMLIITPLFVAGYHLWHGVHLGREPIVAWERLRHPEDGTLWWLSFVATQFIVVALPEEFLFRGYIQKRLDERWTPSWRVLGTTLGPGWLVASALFALVHLSIAPAPHRLLVFFPGLLFGWLRSRSDGIVGPLVAHALSNILIRTVASFYYLDRLL